MSNLRISGDLFNIYAPIEHKLTNLKSQRAQADAVLAQSGLVTIDSKTQAIINELKAQIRALEEQIARINEQIALLQSGKANNEVNVDLSALNAFDDAKNGKKMLKNLIQSSANKAIANITDTDIKEQEGASLGEFNPDKYKLAGLVNLDPSVLVPSGSKDEQIAVLEAQKMLIYGEISAIENKIADLMQTPILNAGFSKSV